MFLNRDTDEAVRIWYCAHKRGDRREAARRYNEMIDRGISRGSIGEYRVDRLSEKYATLYRVDPVTKLIGTPFRIHRRWILGGSFRNSAFQVGGTVKP